MPSPQEWGAAYGARRSTYEEYRRRIENLVSDLVTNADIDIVQIESRTKTVESFREKLRRENVPDDAEDAFAMIHDLVGVRVVTYYSEDVTRVADLIAGQFEIDHEHSMTGSDALESELPGYLSTHVVVRLKNDRAALREWSSYSELPVEIQIRTALQQAWAAVSQKLDHQAAEHAPAGLRRRVQRLSALFEMADEQLSLIRDEAAEATFD